MPGKTPSERAALEAQGELLVSLFERAGFAHIAPDILQPADVFLDRSGENIRSRTFVFADPSGTELCLRPDLTVPACRYHLSHADAPGTEARYCYLGPAFRFQPGGASKQTPAEFEQAGIEWFGDRDPLPADATILGLAIAAVEAAGLGGYAVKLGDLGLFHALLHSIPMPERWRRRLMHQFWRPAAFHALLKSLAAPKPRPRSSISALIDEIARAPEGAATMVERSLDTLGLQLIGGRSLEEIAQRLAEKAADRSEPPLSASAMAAIEGYLALHGRPDLVVPALQGFAVELEEPFGEAVAAYSRRLAELLGRGVDLDRFEFSAGFGRTLEYYTGYVFQIEFPRASDAPLVISGGGRYDRMLADIGSPVPVPAVGCAIYTERLIAAVRGAP